MRHVITVPGVPIPEGSVRTFQMKGRAFTTHSNPGTLARYRNDIRNVWTIDPRGGHRDPAPEVGPFRLAVTFTFKRPADHYTTKGVLKGEKYARPAPTWVEKKPDVDKLVRAVADALTGYAWHDDKQVVMVEATKVWGERAETTIIVESLP